MTTRTLKEIQDDISAYDEDLNHYGEDFDIEKWNAGRKPLIDELEAWHNIPVGQRS
jgi:hypothetical protein